MVSAGWLLRAPVAAVGVLTGQVYWAAKRGDLPSFVDQDPTGDFGDPALDPLRIVAMGDSSVTAPGIDIDRSWTRRVARHLEPRFYVQLRSVAVGGSKARDLLAFQVEAALAVGGDLALISIGANDALRGTPIRRFESELDAAFDALGEHFALIGVAGLGDLGTLPRLPSLGQTVARSRSRAVDHAIRRSTHDRTGVSKGVSRGEAWHRFESHPFEMFSSDLFHASEQGHGLFGNAAIAMVEDLLRSPAGKRLSASPGSLESAT